MKMRKTGVDSVNSWLIALGCSFITMALYSVVEGTGVLFVATMLRFNVNRQSASMLFILTQAVQTITSPLTGYLAHKYGVRPVVVFGCLLSAIGTGACFFAEQIGAVTFFWGVLFGEGFGLASSLLPVIITQHFVNYRAIAIGTVHFGGYMGLIIFPSIMEYLIDCYGLSATFLYISGVMLNCVPVAMLLRKPSHSIDESRKEAGEEISPPEEAHIRNLTKSEPVASIKTDCDRNCYSDSYRRKIQTYDKDSKGGVNNGFELESNAEVDTLNNRVSYEVLKVNTLNETFLQGHEKHTDVSCESFVKNKIIAPQQSFIETPITNSVDSFSISCSTIKKNKMAASWSPYTDRNSKATTTSSTMSLSSFRAFKIFLEPVYIAVLVAEALFEGSFMAFVTIIVDFSRDIDLPLTDGKYVIIAFSVGSGIGILSFGWVTDYDHMTLTNLSTLLFVFRGITMAVIPFSNGLPVLLVLVLLQALCESPHSNLFPLIIADYYSQEVHEVAISCRLFLCAPVYLVTPYLIGYSRDKLGSYFYLFYLMSFSSLLCGVLLFLIPHLSKCKCGREDTFLRNEKV